MPGPVFRRGERLTLRPEEREDLEFLQRLRNDPDVRRPLTIPGPANGEQMEEAFERHAQGDEGVGLLACRDGDPVGKVVLFMIDETHGTATMAYWIAPEAQGNGYATEAADLMVGYAFEERRLNKVSAQALVTNRGSQRVLEKVGFTEVARLPQEKFVDGEYADVLHYSLLAEDWLDR